MAWVIFFTIVIPIMECRFNVFQKNSICYFSPSLYLICFNIWYKNYQNILYNGRRILTAWYLTILKWTWVIHNECNNSKSNVILIFTLRIRIDWRYCWVLQVWIEIGKIFLDQIGHFSEAKYLLFSAHANRFILWLEKLFPIVEFCESKCMIQCYSWSVNNDNY